MDPGLDESFGDGGMCSCFDPDPFPDHSIISHDQQVSVRACMCVWVCVCVCGVCVCVCVCMLLSSMLRKS